MPIVKTCKFSDSSCLSDSVGYKTIDGQTNSSWNNIYLMSNGYSHVLKNGMVVMLSKAYNAGIYTCRAYIDVNGKRGPNHMGRDFFEFYVNPDNNTFEPFGYRNGFFRGKLVNIS